MQITVLIQRYDCAKEFVQLFYLNIVIVENNRHVLKPHGSEYSLAQGKGNAVVLKNLDVYLVLSQSWLRFSDGGTPMCFIVTVILSE